MSTIIWDFLAFIGAFAVISVVGIFIVEICGRIKGIVAMWKLLCRNTYTHSDRLDDIKREQRELKSQVQCNAENIRALSAEKKGK